MTVSEFKAKCLAALHRVAGGSGGVPLARSGKSVVDLVPVNDDAPAGSPLKGGIVHQSDIVNPTDEQWNADRG